MSLVLGTAKLEIGIVEPYWISIKFYDTRLRSAQQGPAFGVDEILGVRHRCQLETPDRLLSVVY